MLIILIFHYKVSSPVLSFKLYKIWLQLNPITSEDLRWNYNHPEVAQYAGNVPDLTRFDAQFFKVHYKLGNNMDSMSRKMLEMAYEAIYDAGKKRCFILFIRTAKRYLLLLWQKISIFVELLYVKY